MANISKELKQVLQDAVVMDRLIGQWGEACVSCFAREEDQVILATGGKKMTIHDGIRDFINTTWLGNTSGIVKKLASLVDDALADKEHKSKMDRVLAAQHAPSGAAPIPPSPQDDDDYTAFLNRNAKDMIDTVAGYLGSTGWTELCWPIRQAVIDLARLVNEEKASNGGNLEKQAFIEGYAQRSGLTVEELRGLGQHVYPCDCGEAGCKGWRMDDPNRLGNILDRALEARHASGKTDPPRGETYFLIRGDANGATHVTMHDKAGLLEAIQPLQCAKTRLWYSDTSEWQGCFLVVRGEIVAPSAKYSGTDPRYVVGWEIG